jgi:uncharacterized membrane-anchored protein
MSDQSPEVSVLALPARMSQAAAPRALGATPTYWFSMFAASALGTNLGDFTVDTLSLGRTLSFAVLAAIVAAAVAGDSRYARRTEGFYWLAIVALRAAATNVGDLLTHDWGVSYLGATIALGIVTLVAGSFTRIEAARSNSPLIDGRYWTAMLVAGIFGTTGGDMASHTFGLYVAAAALCAAAILVLTIRYKFAATSALAYWCVVLAERCAGTPVGDALASHRAVGLGLPLAMTCTVSLLAIGLLVRGRERRRSYAG